MTSGVVPVMWDITRNEAERSEAEFRMISASRVTRHELYLTIEICLSHIPRAPRFSQITIKQNILQPYTNAK